MSSRAPKRRQQQGPDTFLGGDAAGDDQEAAWHSVESIVHTLEAQQSLLTGMFKQWVHEQAGQGVASLSSAARAQHHHHGHFQQHPQHKRARDTEVPLTLTLEDLYRGALKRVAVQLQRRDARSGGVAAVVQQLQVCVQPGLKEGARITLPGLGHADAQGQQGDLTFVVRQALHPDFRRLADDLYVIVSVPLVTALTGGPVTLRTLGGALLQLPVADDAVIAPNSELVVANQGMPVFGDAAGRRGALHVRFRVMFPSSLSREQQRLLRQVLTGTEEGQQQQQQEQQQQEQRLGAAAAGLLRPHPRACLQPPLPAGNTPPAWQQAGQTEPWQRTGAREGPAAGSYASSSSVAELPACMQSTGSSRSDAGVGQHMWQHAGGRERAGALHRP